MNDEIMMRRLENENRQWIMDNENRHGKRKWTIDNENRHGKRRYTSKSPQKPADEWTTLGLD